MPGFTDDCSSLSPLAQADATYTLDYVMEIKYYTSVLPLKFASF